MRIFFIALGILCFVLGIISIAVMLTKEKPIIAIVIAIFGLLAGAAFYGAYSYTPYDCPKCGEEIIRKSNFCSYCGSVLDEENPDKRCVCGNKVEDEIFCPDCGADLRVDGNIRDVPNSEIKEDLKTEGK